VEFQARRLERLFANCFADAWRTRLIGGAGEPYYQPATPAQKYHLLYYRSDYFASALHEIAHWCIAGEERRQLPDFGYWYAPDGRSPAQQRAFEAVESKPQALEWLFSRACGYRFCISVDNLGAPDTLASDTTAFKRQVLADALAWQRDGLPPRAQIFFAVLSAAFDTRLQPRDLDLRLSGLVG
jgi:elongation factor P hydroxylase